MRLKPRRGSWILVLLFIMAFVVPPLGKTHIALALSPVFENTAAAQVILGNQASRSQCGLLTRQGIGPYTMSGTDASSGDPYSYVTNKNYTQPAQFYESGEASSGQQSMQYYTYQSQTYNNRSGVIRLYSNGSIGPYPNICNNHATYGSAYGPEVWTEAFPATQGQALSFNWAAAGGSDDYEAYGYLVKVESSGSGYDYGSSASTTLIAYGRGLTQDWTTSSGIVPSSGYYRFRFVNGTYDATGGKALGASMYIDTSLTVASPNATTFTQPSDIIRSSSDQTFTISAYATSGESVSFTSGTTSKCTVGASTDSNGISTATVTIIANQVGTCTISANSIANSNYVAAATVAQSFSILQGTTAPTTSGGTSVSGDIGYGETVTANDGTWGDGGSAINATSYQWQSCDPNSCTWTNISGANSSSYTIALGDVGNKIRVQVTKTNSIGSLTASSSASIAVPAPTFVNVTNLLDDGSVGSLRWAITTANASSTINTINFDSNNTGTITLTSDLPAISDAVTIDGTGMTTTIIDGQNLYRAVYNNGQRNIVISNMTFKQGKNTTGGIVWTNDGTFTINNVKFTASGGYAWHQQNSTVTSFNNCQFTYLNNGISSDYGSTPSAKSLNDADYSDRIYINNSLFSNNGTAVGTERFVKVNNSTFTNNGDALALNGLNRQQVLNSTFTNNGTAVAMFSWMPASWVPGVGNQLVEGNTFTNNNIAISFNNYFDNGTKTYNGNGVNSWSTARNNTFNNNGTEVTGGYGIVEDSNTVVTTTTTTTTSTTTTTLVPTTTTSTTTTTTSTTTTIVPEPETTTTTEPEPETTTTTEPEPEITTTTQPEPETITTTTISPPVTTIIETIFEPVDTPEVDPTPVVIPEDITPEIIVPKDTQDAADAAVENIFDGPMSNAGIADAVGDLVADAETPEQLTAVVSSLLDQELTDTQFATVIDSVFSEPLSDENFAAAVNTVFEDPTKLSDAQFEDAVTAVFDGPLSDAQFEDAVAAIFEDTKTLSDEQFDAAVQAVFDEPLSTEQFSDALDNIFDEPISDDKFDSVIDSILDAPISNEQFEELVGVLESDTVTEDQVSAAVDSVIENGVTEDQATDLATSEKVLESIDTDQAAEIFDAISVENLSTEEEAALVAAVSDAPDEIKDEFETQIDVYGEGLDDYVPTGSNVDVGSRRTLLAATAALSAATVGVGAGTGSSGPTGGSGGSGGGSGGSGGGPGDGTNSNGRKEDENPEGEEEEDAEIEGPEDQEDNHFTRNSIFKYEEETMKRKFSPWGFIKKISRETSALAFTISGSVVVFATLSGETRKITVIATGCAFLVHYIHAMIKNDED